jgi:hypothetical protein
MTRPLRVYPAEPFRYGALSSIRGDASYMLMRQWNFPDTYSELDKFQSADHDRMQGWDYKHFDRVCQEHLKTGPMALMSRPLKASREQILAFCKDAHKTTEATFSDGTTGEWTGFRILATLNRSNGFLVFSIQLFAKHPDSDTKTYSNGNAPNVKQPEGFDKMCIYGMMES